MRRFPLALLLGSFIALISGPGCSGEADAEGEGYTTEPQEEVRQVGQELQYSYSCFPPPSGQYYAGLTVCKDASGNMTLKCSYLKPPPAVGGSAKILTPTVPAAAVSTCWGGELLPRGERRRERNVRGGLRPHIPDNLQLVIIPRAKNGGDRRHVRLFFISIAVQTDVDMRCRSMHETPIRRTMRFRHHPTLQKKNGTRHLRRGDIISWMKKVHGTTGPALVPSVLNILALCIVALATSSAFIENEALLGPVVFGLGGLCLVSLFPFRVKLRELGPDLVFGAIDNGILAILAVFGGEIGGTVGAVIGGVVGNAVTDGIAGIFEGIAAERTTATKTPMRRTILGSAVGKMAGCLLSAGAVLTVSHSLGI